MVYNPQCSQSIFQPGDRRSATCRPFFDNQSKTESYTEYMQ